jgi:HD-GYP domain-containing protein (c-di-GMP phosphodiesterase class II)
VRVGLRLQLMMLTVILVAVTVSVSSYFFTQQEREVLLREMTRRGATIARNLATISTDSLVSNDSLALATYVESIMHNDGVTYGMILDEKGTVLAHSRVQNVGKPYVEPAGVRPLTNETILIQPYSNETRQRIVDVALPILLRNGVRIGTVHVGLAQKAIDDLVAQAVREVIWIAGGLFLIGVIIAFFFTQLILRPVKALVHGAEVIGEGNLNYKLSITGPNEFAKLGRAFNEMAARLKDLYIGMLRAMAKALQSRDFFAGGHDQRVAEYAAALAAFIGMPGDEIGNLHLAAQVQNLGHIAVPDAILQKTGKLTAEEYEELKKHTRVGAEILNQVPALRGTVPLVLHHHERFDGKGYPSGLKGKDIPLGARILAVADAFDAMTSTQKHRPAMALDQAREELKRSAGSQFDPEIVEAFVEMLSREKETR